MTQNASRMSIQESPRGDSGGNRASAQRRPTSANNSSSSGHAPFSAVERMRVLLYNPPLSLEQLGMKLQVSVVSDCPRLSQGAFIKR